MRARPTVVLLATAALVLAATAAKAWRYGLRQPTPDRTAERSAVADVLARHGWRVLPGAGAGPGAPYDWLAFAHPVCPSRMAVAMLPRNAELRHLVDRDSNGDLAYVVDGRLVKSADLDRTLLRHKALALWPSTREADKPSPLLAITPAPSGRSDCPLPFHVSDGSP